VPPHTLEAKPSTVLVVDDDPDIRESVQLALEGRGFTVVGKPNGREALDWLQAGNRPAVILLDLMMPVMDGWLFRTIQRTDPELSAIPVVVLSAAPPWYSPIDIRDHVIKPLNLDTLLEKLRRLSGPATA
jgi:CheY-like chemotaxis protein